MVYTEKSYMTDAELVSEILNSENPTWMELELAQRIERLVDEMEDMKEHIAVLSIESGKKPLDVSVGLV